MTKYYELKYIYENKIGGYNVITIGAFDDLVIATAKTEEIVDKTIDNLHETLKKFASTNINLTNSSYGVYSIQVEKGFFKEWHTFVLEQQEMNTIHYEVEDLL